MAKLTVENLPEVLGAISKGFEELTERNLKADQAAEDRASERKRILDEAGVPEPLTVEQLGEKLDVRIDPNHRHDTKTLLSLFDKLAVLPQETEGYTLIAASCLYLAKEHAPRAIKKGSPLKKI